MRESHHLFINGEWIAGEGTERAILNPANESKILSVQEASKKQASDAVFAAGSAFENTDWAINKEKRVELLRKLAGLLEENIESFAKSESINTGKPIRESRLDISDAAACLHYYADLVNGQKAWEASRPDGSISKVIEEPIGVCSLIVPWNFPLLLGMWKIAPALAAGNTVVFKPSELTALSAIQFTELIGQCDFPPGVFNLVLGAGRPVGETLITHPETDKVSFTGGSESGKLINQLCAGSFKRVSLELGGKSPILVMEDADIDAAVGWAVFGSFFNQGEVCVASSRILVHEDIHENFTNALLKKLQNLTIGDPLKIRRWDQLLAKPISAKLKDILTLEKKKVLCLDLAGNGFPKKATTFHLLFLQMFHRICELYKKKYSGQS